MATRNAVMDNGKAATKGDFSIIRVSWSGLLNGDVGAPLAASEWPDRTVQVAAIAPSSGVASVLGAGFSISMEGSNDYIPSLEDGGNPANAGTWTILTDQNGAAMTYSAIALKQMTEAPLWVRPHVTAGDGTTNVAVVLSGRRSQSMMRGG